MRGWRSVTQSTRTHPRGTDQRLRRFAAVKRYGTSSSPPRSRGKKALLRSERSSMPETTRSSPNRGPKCMARRAARVGRGATGTSLRSATERPSARSGSSTGHKTRSRRAVGVVDVAGERRGRSLALPGPPRIGSTEARLASANQTGRSTCQSGFDSAPRPRRSSYSRWPRSRCWSAF
jgi:hypothetical protein